MAYFLMLPDGVDAGEPNEWHNYGGASFEASVESNDGATSYVYEQAAANQEITFTLANPSVAEESIDFDEDVTVRAHMNADYTFAKPGATYPDDDTGSGGAPHTYSSLNIQLTGTGISIVATAKTLTTEDGSYPQYSGSSNTNKAFLTPWDYAGLENCQVKLENTTRPARFHPIRVTHVYVRVDYTAAVVAVKDNATFFGANF